MNVRVFGALLLFVSFLAGQQPVKETTEEKSKKQARIEGQLLNAVTGEPVRKANLTLKPESGGTNIKAVTDNEGKFAIENIDPGRFTLGAERQGFVTMNYGAKRPLGPGSPIELKAEQTLKNVTFKLTPQGIIAGRVADDDGEPVSGVSISVLNYQYMMGKKRLIPASAMSLITTNDLGEFRAPNLPPGRYYVVTSSQKLMDIQSGVERAAKAQSEGLIPTFYPNAPDVTTASPVDVAPGAEVRGIDIRLRKSKVFRVSGKVVNGVTGEPLSAGMLMVFKRETGGMSVVPSSMYMIQGGKGAFELRNVPQGGYSLLAVSTNPQDMMVSMQGLDVTESDIENLVVTMGTGADIPVTAKLIGVQAPPPEQAGTDASKAKPNAATDLTNIRIVLNVDENPMASLANATLDKEGKATLKRVNPDKYKVIVAGLPPGSYLKSAKFGDRDALDGGLDLRQGGGGSLDLVIAAPAAQLSGMVRNEKGEPAPGAMVTLIPKDAKARVDMAKTSIADQNGNIRVMGIVPGEYNIFAWEDIEAGAAEDEEFRKPFDSKGKNVKLSEGSTEAVQLTLITREAVEAEKAKR